jgi:hypothetical protein
MAPDCEAPTLSEELDLQDLDINRDDRTRREDLERALEERKRHERDQLGKRKFWVVCLGGMMPCLRRASLNSVSAV